MTKKNYESIDKETEVTLEDIAALSGTSRQKVGLVATNAKYGFPALLRLGPKRKVLFSRAAVVAWLENNNIKAMKLNKDDRTPVKSSKKADKAKAAAHFAALPTLQVGIKPKKFAGGGRSYRVTTEEHHEYEPLSHKLMPPSHSAEHRYVGRSFE